MPAVPPDELLGWVAAADVVAMPIQPSTLNHRLTTPNKLFEAMAVGVPVVASDLPGMAPIVRETGCGVVCDPTDPAAIAAAIASILDAPGGRAPRVPGAGARGRARDVLLGAPGRGAPRGVRPPHGTTVVSGHPPGTAPPGTAPAAGVAAAGAATEPAAARTTEVARARARARAPRGPPRREHRGAVLAQPARRAQPGGRRLGGGDRRGRPAPARQRVERDVRDPSIVTRRYAPSGPFRAWSTADAASMRGPVRRPGATRQVGRRRPEGRPLAAHGPRLVADPAPRRPAGGPLPRLRHPRDPRRARPRRPRAPRRPRRPRRVRRHRRDPRVQQLRPRAGPAPRLVPAPRAPLGAPRRRDRHRQRPDRRPPGGDVAARRATHRPPQLPAALGRRRSRAPT